MPGPGTLGSLTEFATALFRVDGATRSDVLEALRFATERFPTSHDAWFALGRTYGFAGNTAQSLAALRKALELRPEHDLIRRSVAVAERPLP